MNLVKLNLYARGCYSRVEYNEVVFMLEEDYKTLGVDSEGLEVCVGEVDGENSKVSGNIKVTILEESEQEYYNYDNTCDGTYLICEIYDMAEAKGIDKDVVIEMLVRADEYIDELDSIVEVSYNVKKSQVKHLDRVFENLW
jgi:hypothetical protein